MSVKPSFNKEMSALSYKYNTDYTKRRIQDFYQIRKAYLRYRQGQQEH
jgi:hypothetical protein